MESVEWEVCWLEPGGTLQNRTEAVPYCEVVDGGESVQECPVWQEFVRFNEIKLKKEK